MPKYTYRARDKSGQLITGEIEGPDEYTVVSNLRGAGYSVTQITAQPPLQEFAASSIQMLKRVSRQEVIVFTRQLATLLRTGNTLTSSLDNVAEQVRNLKFKMIIKEVSRNVQSGLSFSEAVSKHPRVFDGFFVSMVRVAETAGLLDEVLERLATLGTQELELRTRIQSALLYPVALVILSLLVVNFILIGVLPHFVAIFEASQAKLPFPTRVILGLSWTLRNLWFAILAVLVLAGIWLNRRLSTSQGRYDADRRLLNFPLFGDLYLKVMIARFSRAMAALTKSGIPFIEGLRVVEKTVPNLVLRRTFEEIRREISEGKNLTDAFKAAEVFPPMVVQLINSAEKSGRLDEMFSEVASFYEPEIEYSLRNMTSLLEPFLLLVMGVIVGFIALSVLLPIFNLIRLIRY